MTKSTGKYVARGTIFAFVLAAIESRTDDCIVWPKPTVGGYAVFNIAGRRWRAHRFVCVAVHGEAPFADADVAHGCGKPACVNPRHLRWATRAENLADTIAHGTHRQGEAMHSAKLTAAEIQEIRKAKGNSTQREVAARFGVDQSTISLIQQGKRWSHACGARHNVTFHDPDAHSPESKEVA